ncbi:MAG: DNA-3-methyladenine glycosylase [Planctomycetaceae bacterium]
MSFDEAEVKQAIKRLVKVDPVLGKVIRRVGDFALKTESGGYEILVRSILSQQISIAAAKTIRTRLQELLPSKKIRAEDIQALSDEQLQSVGISQQKRTYLRDLTRCTLDGTICFRRLRNKPDDEAIEELIQVKGIGRWTAQMYLMFSLGRLDVFAVGDLGIRNAMIALYGLQEKPTITELECIAGLWSPHRSIASWYLWRALDQKLISTEYPV